MSSCFLFRWNNIIHNIVSVDLHSFQSEHIQLTTTETKGMTGLPPRNMNLRIHDTLLNPTVNPERIPNKVLRSSSDNESNASLY